VQVNFRRGDFFMPQPILDGSQISPGFQQVRRERVPQRVALLVRLNPRRSRHQKFLAKSTIRDG
jgi:hypothetical protein